MKSDVIILYFDYLLSNPNNSYTYYDNKVYITNELDYENDGVLFESKDLIKSYRIQKIIERLNDFKFKEWSDYVIKFNEINIPT